MENVRNYFLSEMGVDMNEANYNNYTNQLLVQLKHGYKVARITENRITVVYELL